MGGLNEVKNASQQYESIANHIDVQTHILTPTHVTFHSSGMVSFQFGQFMVALGNSIGIGFDKFIQFQTIGKIGLKHY